MHWFLSWPYSRGLQCVSLSLTTYPVLLCVCAWHSLASLGFHIIRTPPLTSVRLFNLLQISLCMVIASLSRRWVYEQRHVFRVVSALIPRRAASHQCCPLGWSSLISHIGRQYLLEVVLTDALIRVLSGPDYSLLKQRYCPTLPTSLHSYGVRGSRVDSLISALGVYDLFYSAQVFHFFVSRTCVFPLKFVGI